MRRLALLLLLAAFAGVAMANSFTVLSYHEVRDDVRDYPDPYAVDADALVRQFAWLRGNGYTPVSLDEIITARKGGKPLPAKAVLLSFDDAYLSFYARVYPLLLEYRYPAVLGVVGKWIDEPRGAVLYGEKASISAASFPTWAQLREMAASGLVEIASHSYDLHRGVPANPQGNLQPAATTRAYDPASRSYESDTSWRARVRADLARSADVISRETGRRPRAVVWPYGSYNEELVRMAGELGMPVALTLDDGVNSPAVPLNAMRRTLIEHNPTLAEFALEVRGPLHSKPLRVVQVRLDDVYSADPAQQERHLSALLDRIQVLKPTHVFLQATASADGAAYFPNRHVPLRGDLFNRAAWQLASRVDVKVYAVMPVNAFRLAPAAVADVYEDLARHSAIDGLVFQDGDIAFTRQLASRARAFRAPLMTVRAAPSARDVPVLATEYDFVLLTSPAEFAEPRTRVIYLLSPGSTLAGQMRKLQLGGALNFGYGPDDFLHDNPPLAQIAPAMSLRVNPLAAEGKPR